jgi:rhodanese-related sulfurtransferase
MSVLRFPRRLLLAAVLAAVSGPAFATDTPERLDRAKLVTAKEVDALRQQGVAIFDVRVSAEYAEKHIVGAINVPYREKSAKAVDFDAAQDSFALAKLPADKTIPVIFACNGPECWKSYKASVVTLAAGYQNVYWFRGGFPDWQANGLPTE